jgi:hypothetical protein
VTVGGTTKRFRMLGVLVVLTIILVLILINKNTKSTPEGMGCVQQGCLWVFAFLAFGMWVSNQQAEFEVERSQKQRSERVAPAPQVMFTEVKIADASNPSEHKASYDASTSKIVVNCRVIGAAPGTPLTGKWYLLGSGTRQLLQEATVSAAGPNHPAFFSVTRPSNQLSPVGTYEVELWASDSLCETLTFCCAPQ